MYHVRRAAEIALDTPAAYAADSDGHRRAVVVGPAVGAVHTGITQCVLDSGGTVGEHLHSYEKSFYVHEGRPRLTIEGRTWQLQPDDCGLVPLGVPHAWRNAGADGGEPARWVEASAPAPRPPEHPSPDTFFTGASAPDAEPETLDIRDPRARTFFRLEPGQMELDNLRIGAPVDAPTVSASMATALLAYSGIALKMLVDPRLGAVLHQMFMVEYEPGGAAQLHDHPLEESYTIISGEVDAEADGERFTLYAGDVFWTGVGCVHGFWNNSGGRVRFLETQSPQLPANHSYRFNRDWDYLAERLNRSA
jgi:quercetin dioxygenase-like cupin family protein